MKLKKFALLAEIGSGIAVVITLIVLIFGINENSDLTRLSIYSDHINAMNQWQESTIEDPELAVIYVSYLNPDMEIPTDGPDFMRLNQLIQSLFRIYESAWFSREYDVIGEREWARFERAICQNFERNETYGLIYRASLTDAFLEYMESSCSLPRE